MKRILGAILRWPWSLGTAIVLLWNHTRAGKRIVETEYDINSQTLPKSFDGLRIVHLTDLHGRELGKNQQDILDRVARLEPDLVLLTGDMYGESLKKQSRRKVNHLMKELADRYPVYAILGNHESRSKAIEEIVREMRGTGVRLLRDQAALVSRGGERIGICGLETNPMKDILDRENDTILDQRLAVTVARYADDAVPYRILLAHKPELLDAYQRAGADLVLSGHAHGGLLEVPFLHRRLLAPGQGFFPAFTQGIYQKENTILELSSGLGGPRYRLQPEIVLITMHRIVNRQYKEG